MSEGDGDARFPEAFLARKMKAELRKRMAAVRKTTPASACAERSHRIVAALEAHEAVRAARRVALFWPIERRHEVDLRALDASLRARGAVVAYPAIDPDAGVMTFREVRDTAELEERGMGFSEPAAGTTESDALDVIVVPALAVDARGHRVGYGAGWYDRTLPRFSPPAVTIGVAFEWQLVVEVPASDTDRALDWVVTDARVLRASG